MHDAKQEGVADSIEGRKALQRDLDKAESWAIPSNMRFSKSE